MSELLPASPGRVVQLANDFAWDGHPLEPGIGLALSGGGFRAMLFHAGALMRLNELGLLSRVTRISGVSGGSIAAGFLASIWGRLGEPDATGSFNGFQATYVEPMLAFSRQKIDIGAILSGLLPWNSAARRLAASYDQRLLHGVSLQQIPDQPHFVFCATNLQTGVLWRFSKPYAGDYVVGRLDRPDLGLADVIAASSALPPYLSPMALNFPQGSFTDWPGQPAGAGGVIDPTPFRAKVLLTDGGVYDNLGLEPIVKRYTTLLVSNGGAPFQRNPEVATNWLCQLRRVADVMDNQVRALRLRDLLTRFKAGAGLPTDRTADPMARSGAYWGIDTDPARVGPPDALPCGGGLVSQLARLATRLSDLGETPSRQLINWGYAICDRCVRVHYDVPATQHKPAPRWPFPEVPLG
jgi:NTE family protein